MVASPVLEKHVARAGYAAGLLIVIIPLADSLPAAYPLHLGVAQWRFGMVGLLSGAFMTPLLGLFMLLATAALAGHQRRLRALGVTAIVVAAVLAIISLSFLFDYLQVHGTAVNAVRPGVTGASIKVLFKLGVFLIVSVVYALAALGLTRRGHESAAPPPLVGQSGRSAT